MALEKAIITNTVTKDNISVLFNPEEYTINKDINYAQTAIPGLSAPILQFVNGNMSTLEMELLVDSYEEHRKGSQIINSTGDDVRKLTQKITDLMVIHPSTHAPPVLLFTWASLSFTCVLARASQRFIMFRPDGTPVRARLQVTFNEFRNGDLEAKEIKRETSDYSRWHEVKQGETLNSIAWQAYGNPRLWRPIALRNGIDSPLALPTGLQLVVPHLPFRDPDTGEVHG
jgi:nucleoid-associated protein YgaU